MENYFYRVIQADESHGYAQLQREPYDDSEPRLSELYIASGARPTRLRVGDLVAAAQNGRRYVQVLGFVSQASPPSTWLAYAERLSAPLRAAGIKPSEPLEVWANLAWRTLPRHGDAWVEVRARIVSLLAKLFDWGRCHPLEDPQLAARFTEAMREHCPGFAVAWIETPEDDEEVGVFQIRTMHGATVHEKRSDEDWDWENPAPAFAGLCKRANVALGETGSPLRWMLYQHDWLLAPPGLVESLEESQTWPSAEEAARDR